jgi:uncharacterized protein YegJ (DUF2314 family)
METVRRDKQPDVYNVTGDDEPMNAAISRARATLGTFHKYLQKTGNGNVYAMVKARFTAGARTEHIWVANARWDGTRYHGLLVGEPAYLKRLHHGDPVTIAPDQVSDWMVIVDDVMLGAYTTLEIRRRLSPREREDFDRELGWRVVADTAVLRVP